MRGSAGASNLSSEEQSGVEAGVDLSAASVRLLAEVVAAARRVGRPARVHLKIDTGLSRGGAGTQAVHLAEEPPPGTMADGRYLTDREISQRRLLAAFGIGKPTTVSSRPAVAQS